MAARVYDAKLVGIIIIIVYIYMIAGNVVYSYYFEKRQVDHIFKPPRATSTSKSTLKLVFSRDVNKVYIYITCASVRQLL